MNKAWARDISSVLIYHYAASDCDCINTSNNLDLRPAEMEQVESWTVRKALKRFWKKSKVEPVK